jgi:hypothetical protein
MRREEDKMYGIMKTHAKSGRKIGSSEEWVSLLIGSTLTGHRHRKRMS